VDELETDEDELAMMETFGGGRYAASEQEGQVRRSW
jgi:hypothetical protein